MIKKGRKKLIERLSDTGVSFSVPESEATSLSLRNKIKKCLWNALLVFLFSYGIIGVLISAFSFPCDMLKIAFFTALFSVYCSFLFFNRLFFAAGNILAVLYALTYVIRNYETVYSGFNAITNLILQGIDAAIDLSYVRKYDEILKDRTVTITCTALLISFITVYLYNIWISKRKKHFLPLLLCVIVFEASIYLEDRYSVFYLFISLLGIALSIATRLNDETPAKLEKASSGFQVRRGRMQLRKRTVEYKGNIVYGTVFVTAVLIIFYIMSAFVPKSYLNTNSPLKSKTDKIVSQIAVSGFSSLFSTPNERGSGLNNGDFNKSINIKYDYKTDLELTAVPYSNKTVYIPSYSASRFDSDKRKWSRTYNPILYSAEFSVTEILHDCIYTADDDKSDGENSNKTKKDVGNCGEGRAILKNIGLDNSFSVSLYYYRHSSNLSSNVSISKNSSVIIPFYTMMYDYHNLPDISDYTFDRDNFFKADFGYYYNDISELETEIRKEYLGVPSVIEKKLKDICFKEKLEGETTAETVDNIIRFLSEGYEYTLSPEDTPEGEDVIIHFLNDSKEGYCMHFASAACLLLREMDIPAKYVEGYIVTPQDYKEAKAFSKDNIDDLDEMYFLDSDGDVQELTEGNLNRILSTWYEGYSERADKKPVTVSITDENAHAWVEVYFDGFGWVPIEFTVGYSSYNGADVNADGSSFSDTVGTVTENISGSILAMLINLLIFCLIAAAALKLILSYFLFFIKNDRRAVYQYRFLVFIVKRDLCRKYRDKSDEIRKAVISHSDLKKLLAKEYRTRSKAAMRSIEVYEEFSYSEFGCGVNIDTVTSCFKNLSYYIIRNFGILRRGFYMLCLYIPKRFIDGSQKKDNA